ncbi:MAG TPA: hypothetical protein VMT20_03025 [Terriglobia bacterium]|nr:hypothetical protein [Terriglobia bacterium]
MNPNFDTLRQQRDELYQDARNHPDSDAEQMVKILLLSALSNQQSGEYDAHFGDRLARERRGYRQARAKRIQERWEGGPSEAATLEQPGAEVAAVESRGQAVGGEGGNREGGEGASPADAEMRLKKVAQALENAKVAAESGKEMDPLTVYARIAEIVGLRAPLQPIGQEPN